MLTADIVALGFFFESYPRLNVVRVFSIFDLTDLDREPSEISDHLFLVSFLGEGVKLV